jgi:thiol-disulfide isomerase/thioredoxin
MIFMACAQSILLAELVSGQSENGNAADAGARETLVFRAWLDSPGGELPFIVRRRPARRDAPDPRHAAMAIENGSEEIELCSDSNPGRLKFPHYDSFIEAHQDNSVRAPRGDPRGHFIGTWRKASRDGRHVEMIYHAEPFRGYRFKPLESSEGADPKAAAIEGRWSVKFSRSDEPGIAVFTESDHQQVAGTILTETGDYRYLAGSYKYGTLRLSCFDGAHAFLFHARVLKDGTLQGDFWSGDAWHETWTARRDDDAEMTDGFQRTTWSGAIDWEKLPIPDASRAALLKTVREPGCKAILLEVFGSWCPNCHDAAALLGELDGTYRGRGLRVVGLAFELTGRAERDNRQIARFADRHGVGYPMLLAGKADKIEAARVLPALDGVRSFPTFIFARPDGSIHAVYSGFSGPATEKEHADQRHRFKSVVTEMLKGAS